MSEGHWKPRLSRARQQPRGFHAATKVALLGWAFARLLETADHFPGSHKAGLDTPPVRLVLPWGAEGWSVLACRSADVPGVGRCLLTESERRTFDS